MYHLNQHLGHRHHICGRMKVFWDEEVIDNSSQELVGIRGWKWTDLEWKENGYLWDRLRQAEFLHKGYILVPAHPLISF